MIISKTKTHLTTEEIDVLVLEAFGITCVAYEALTDGFYNASYLIRLEDGREVVLKVAPREEVVVMTYEQDIMATEVLFYQLTASETDVLIPEILYYEPAPKLIDSPYYFMTKLEGKALYHVKDLTPDKRRPIYEALAKDLAKMHGIKGQTFGYRTMEEACRGKSYFDAFMVSFDALIRDCMKVGQALPIEEAIILNLLSKTQPAFDQITRPCMVHFDLWDGNIFVLDKDPLELSGYIDFERGFYGDPAADFCQAAGYLNLEDNPWFLELYNQEARKPLVLDQAMKIRMMAYRFYLFLLMYVECFYRDVDGSFEGQKEWVTKELSVIKDDLTKLTV